MLDKSHRLRDDKTIAKTLRIGRRVSHSAVSLVIAKSGGAKTKVAVVVGTKIDKRAVVRNRLKRRTREALRPLIPRVAPGFDIVAFPRLPLAEIPFEELKKIFEDLLSKAQILV